MIIFLAWTGGVFLAILAIVVVIMVIDSLKGWIVDSCNHWNVRKIETLQAKIETIQTENTKLKEKLERFNQLPA